MVHGAAKERDGVGVMLDRFIGFLVPRRTAQDWGPRPCLLLDEACPTRAGQATMFQPGLNRGPVEQ